MVDNRKRKQNIRLKQINLLKFELKEIIVIIPMQNFSKASAPDMKLRFWIIFIVPISM